MKILENILQQHASHKANFSDGTKNFEPSEIDKIFAEIDDLKKQINKIVEEKTDVAPILLTVQEAADYLRVSVSTINNLKDSKQIGCHKIGGNVRFTYKDLLGFCFNITSAVYVECKRSIIYLDKKSSEVIPFEENNIYRKINENKIWISLFSSKFSRSARFSKKEFNKYFSVADDTQREAIGCGLGIWG